MDPLTLAFYGLVCGTLGWAGPRLGRPPVRFAIGLVVGLVAATILPMIRGQVITMLY